MRNEHPTFIFLRLQALFPYTGKFRAILLPLRVHSDYMSDNLFLDRLAGIRARFEEVEQMITDPAIIADMKKFVKLNKEYRELEPLVEAFREYKTIIENLRAAQDILANEKDEELRELARSEMDEMNGRVGPMEEKIRLLLVPADPEDSKNAIIEIRAGTGGDEASIFAGDLFRMYSKFFERRGWKMEVTSSSEGTMGGYKEVVANVKGNGVYGILKYESGVHRVQRVPQTETQGRIHTSAATVAVLPEAEEFEVEVRNEDIRKDTFCSSGPGGQSVNTTYSAVRLTHNPTGIVVSCQDEKSQIKNYEKALNELRTRIYNLEYQKYLDEISSKRRTMVSTGDRSAKIRTYNYPQGRVTDHRINLTLYNLSAILDGDIQEIIDQLQVAENAERLKVEEI
jgi:peptide chain release factor 1